MSRNGEGRARVHPRIFSLEGKGPQGSWRELTGCRRWGWVPAEQRSGQCPASDGGHVWEASLSMARGRLGGCNLGLLAVAKVAFAQQG